VRFIETRLNGVFVIEPERRADERGCFARSWCREEFAAHGIEAAWVQSNISYSHRRGTLRGLHYQAPPAGEAKLVRCTRGAIYDVLVDVRPGSPTFLDWLGIELAANTWRMVYAPAGFAHGYQTLTDDAEVFYEMSHPYCPEAGRGLRWDDPVLGIVWPECRQRILSARDLAWPLLNPGRAPCPRITLPVCSGSRRPCS
jgi:dTDP-4-dehydrorhamnose 3,5-epimerase